MPLTDTECKNARPQDKPHKLSDGLGMYLLVNPNGARYWRMKYRFAGKEKLLALGVYPETSLKDARTRRDQARKILDAGTDPLIARAEHKRTAAIEAENSFETVGREWLDAQCNRWTASHATNVTQSLEREVFPRIGVRPIATITAPELLSMVRTIEKRDALEMASRVLQRCGAIFRYGISTGRCARNPVGDLQGALKTRPVTHYARLSQSDLPEFLRKLDKADLHAQTKLAIRFLMLTFVRTGELRGAEWPEFDFDRAAWRIPATRMKMRSEHIVPLSRQAVEVLRQVQQLNGKRRYVFANLHFPDRPMSENTILYALYRMGYHSRMTGHGFRGLACTILNERGFTPDAIERQLAHTERNKVRAAYSTAEYLPERKKMMQRWADYLDATATGAKVIPLHSAA